MRLEYEALAVAGQRFSVRLSGAVGPTRLTVHVGTVLLLAVDCPDPPCHEVFEVPSNAFGEKLRLVAVDSTGSEVREEVEVVSKGLEEGYGHSRGTPGSA